jgi:hypothetical protein
MYLRHVLAGCAALLVVEPPFAAAQSEPTQRPIRLVIHIAVDQLRPDYLVRWSGEFNGGFARLIDEGVFYVAGEQDHAVTQTAPGHSTMLSGRWPASTGILSNDLGVGDPQSPLVGGSGSGASPHRFRGTALYDWMLAADPETRVLSVSRKDRGAILPIGRARVPVFWYSGGRFTTSRWYADTLPTWLADWNARDPVASLRGRVWMPLDDIRYPESDERDFETGGRSPRFPHVIPDDSARAASELTGFPVMDSLTLDVAWHGLRALQLGKRNGTDLLAISLSTTDEIGHTYGPGSLEMHDHIRRLDRHLGWFLDSLATHIPLDQVQISLTADHGATEYPEAHGTTGRVSIAIIGRELNAWARERYAIDLRAQIPSGLLLADTRALTARGVDVPRLADSLASIVARLPGVRKVYTPSTLAATGDAESMMWRRHIGPDTDWLIAVSLHPGWIWSSSNTSTGHGTTNLDDVRIPILFRVPGVPAARIERPVGVVDIGPTHAGLLGISPTEPLDGRPLPEVVRTQR